MRLLLAACALTACARPAAAGPLDTWAYRTTLNTTLLPGPGPAQPGETAYPLGADPAFGVVAAGVADWAPAFPAHPGAGFSVVTLGRLTAFTAADDPRGMTLGGSGEYALGVELRDAAGRTGAVTFRGRFEAGWWGEYGYASPVWDEEPAGSRSRRGRRGSGGRGTTCGWPTGGRPTTSWTGTGRGSPSTTRRTRPPGATAGTGRRRAG
jgi:hypothetical protein